MSIFEIGMLICFGASWPFAIAKTLKTKSVKGKSLSFIFMIFLGYVFGILHKVIYNLDIVIWLYIYNLTMTMIDMALYFKYRERDTKGS